MLSADALAPDVGGAGAAKDLSDIKARLIVFGESEVVCEVANFLRKHQGLSGDEARQDFGAVIRAMRKSVATGSGAAVIVNALELVSPPRQR
jgi:hypothetical protein